MILQVGIGYVANGFINSVMGPVLAWSAKDGTYAEQKRRSQGRKDIFPLDPPALINHTVCGFAKPSLVKKFLVYHGFKNRDWNTDFFEHTKAVENEPKALLGYQVNEFKPPNDDTLGQMDVAAWHTQSTPDLIAIQTLLNRGNINMQVATNWMRKSGWRDSGTTSAMLNLRNEIPPLADLTRFAVRDSFTPESVAFYKEANEYPQILDKYVGWLGLGWPTGLTYGPSTDDNNRPVGARPATWGHIYWASHWIEPSPTQGYEMLFRGYTFSPYGPSPYVTGARGAPDDDLTFDEDDLKKLLKSADYGPYWRKRLEMIAYHPYNITDVKRMYRIGVMDRPAVYHAMRALGYHDTMADQMTDYIIRTERPQITPNVQRSYMLGIITEPQAREILSNGGLSQREIDFAIAKWKIDLQNREAETGLRMIHRSMLTGEIANQVARGALAQLGIDPQRIEMYLRQWESEIAVSKRSVTLAKLMKWYVDGIITEDDFVSRLQRLKYRDTDISNILKEARARERKQRETADAREQSREQREQRQRDSEAKQAQSQAAKRSKEQERQAKDRAKEIQDREKQVEMLAKGQRKSADERLKLEQESFEEMLASIRKGSTDKYLIAWHKKGLLSTDQVRERLSIRGMTKEDIDRWVNTYIPGAPNA